MPSASTRIAETQPTKRHDEQAASTGVSLIGGGKALVSCTANLNLPNARSVFVGYDLYDENLTWIFDPPHTRQIAVGSQHLFYLTSTYTKATGLSGASTHYTLTALDLQTGKRAWQAPFPMAGGRNYRQNLVVSESPTSTTDPTPAAVVSLHSSTIAFNDQTGKQLWAARDDDFDATEVYAGQTESRPRTHTAYRA